MSTFAIGQRVRAHTTDSFDSSNGTIVAFAGLVCEGAVYVDIGIEVTLEGRRLPGMPFDPHELEALDG